MPYSDPERNRTYKRRWQAHRRKALKAKLIEHLGGECCRCGFKDFPEGLEFHHINRSTKNPRLRKHIGFRELTEADAMAEVEGCLLLCSNCHRGLEAGAITLD